MRKLRDHFLVEAAACEVFAGAGAFGAAQAFLKKRDGAFVDVEELAAQAGFFGFAGSGVTGLGQRNAQLLRDQRTDSGKVMFSIFWMKLKTSPETPQPKQ